MKISRLLPILSLATSIALAQNADRIYYNGKIVTVSTKAPIAEAVAIHGDRFLAVGSNEEVLKFAGPATEKVDLKGRTVLPGIVESHTHPIMAALSEREGPVPVMHSFRKCWSTSAGRRPCYLLTS